MDELEEEGDLGGGRMSLDCEVGDSGVLAAAVGFVSATLLPTPALSARKTNCRKLLQVLFCSCEITVVLEGVKIVDKEDSPLTKESPLAEKSDPEDSVLFGVWSDLVAELRATPLARPACNSRSTFGAAAPAPPLQTADATIAVRTIPSISPKRNARAVLDEFADSARGVRSAMNDGAFPTKTKGTEQPDSNCEKFC